MTEYSPAATTATVTTPTVAVGQQRILFGYGVAKLATGVSINTTKVKKPTAITDLFAGVIFRTPSSGIPDASVLALDPDYDVTYLPPGFAYSLGWRDMGICVEYVGAAPTETDPVYWICTGTNAGKWQVSDGAVSQVTQGDVESNVVAAVSQVTRGDVQFNGGANVFIHAISSSTDSGFRDEWLNLLMYIPNPADVHLTGGSGSTFTGTILAPKADVTMQGATDKLGGDVIFDSQIIADIVEITGNTNLTIVYNETNNAQAPTNPGIALIK